MHQVFPPPPKTARSARDAREHDKRIRRKGRAAQSEKLNYTSNRIYVANYEDGHMHMHMDRPKSARLAKTKRWLLMQWALCLFLILHWFVLNIWWWITVQLYLERLARNVDIISDSMCVSRTPAGLTTIWSFCCYINRNLDYLYGEVANYGRHPISVSHPNLQAYKRLNFVVTRFWCCNQHIKLWLHVIKQHQYQLVLVVEMVESQKLANSE